MPHNLESQDLESVKTAYKVTPMAKRFSNIIGFDDAPFPKNHRGNVKVVGTLYAKTQLNGILVGEIQKDGSDAAKKLISLIARSKFAESIQLVMLQGIAMGGFNVVDVFALYAQLDLPVLVVSRKIPNMKAIKDALLTIPGGRRKWSIIEKLGDMEPVHKVYVQRVGLTIKQATTVVNQFTATGHVPEPLRVAHLIAGAIVNGQSRGRV